MASVDLSAVAERFGLGRVLEGPRPVAVGALSNRLWRVEAASGCFAVKEMVSHADREWLVPQVEAAFAIELRARAAGVPVPQPVPDPLTGCCLARIGGRLVRVHQWMNGRGLTLGGADCGLAGLAGDLLARIHRATGPPGGGEREAGEPFAAGHWAALAGRIERRAPVLAGQVRADAAFLAALQARTTIPAPAHDLIDSHADLNPKNALLRPDGSLAAVDWDAARTVSAGQELVQVALDWAAHPRTQGGIDPARLQAVLDSYRAAGGPASPERGPTAFGAWICSWAWWLDYQLDHNVAGGAGIEAGVREAAITLGTLRHAARELDAWTALLRS